MSIEDTPGKLYHRNCHSLYHRVREMYGEKGPERVAAEFFSVRDAMGITQETPGGRTTL